MTAIGSTLDMVTAQPLAEGKTKIIRLWADDPTMVVMEHKDTISAGDGARRNLLPGKGGWSCQTMDACFRLLEASGITTHYVRKLTETSSLVRRCRMIPIEVVTRRIATGSYLKRHPVVEGTRFDPLLVEFFLKDDARHDPQITIEEMHAAGIATPAETERLHDLAVATFTALEEAWAEQDVVLVDLKIECGRVLDAAGAPLGQLVVADIIDNDSWRIWPHGDKNRMLDKQIYRDMTEVTDPALQRLAERYAQVAEMTNAFTA